MKLKYKSAKKVINRKIWRDNQIRNISSDLGSLEDTIRDNWDSWGHIDRGVLYSAHDYIGKYLNKRDKKIISLKDWIQELDELLDERASFASCLR